MTQHRRSRVLRNGVFAATAAGALILAGCSSSGSSDESADSAQEFSFTFATSNNLESPYETLANEYMEANPNVTITVNPTPNDRYGETIRTQLQAGNAPDVIQTAPGSGDSRGIIPLAEAGFLEPLDDDARNIIPEGSESLFEIDDEVYGQPVDFTVIGMLASMGTARQNGIEEFPTTFEDLIDTCAGLRDSGKSLIALAGAAAPNVGLTLQSISATRVFAEDPEWNQKRIDGEVTFADSEGWRDTFETFLELSEQGCFQPGAEGGGFDAITNGLSQGTSVSTVIPSGSAVEIAAAAPPEVDFKALPFPPADGGEDFLIASSNYALSINAASDKKDAANAFLDWMATPEAQERYYELSGLLPIVGYQDLDLSDTLYAPVVDLIASGSYTPLPNNIWPSPAVYDALAVGGQGVLTGQLTIDQALAGLDDAWG